MWDGHARVGRGWGRVWGAQAGPSPDAPISQPNHHESHCCQKLQAWRSFRQLADDRPRLEAMLERQSRRAELDRARALGADEMDLEDLDLDPSSSSSGDDESNVVVGSDLGADPLAGERQAFRETETKRASFKTKATAF